jgi:tetratricopeptide (TPR) repeat protein
MTLVALGLNHQTAPVALRERVAFSREALPEALRALRAVPGVAEAALISTCNRSEIYAVLDPKAQAGLREFLAGAHGLTAASVDEYLYCHEDGAAAKHFARAAELSDDPAVAEHATRVALVAKESTLARACLARWRKLAPDALGIAQSEAVLLLNEDKMDDAVVKLVELLRQGDQGRKLVAQLLLSVVNGEVSEKLLGKLGAVDELPGGPDVAVLLSQVAFQIKQPGLALDLADRALKRYPESAAAYAWRGRLLATSEPKDPDRAKADFEKALALEPTNKVLRLAYAATLEDAGKSAEAARFLGAGEQDDDILVARAAYAARANDPAELKGAYAALKALAPPRSDARLELLGQLGELTGAKKEAMAFYKEVGRGERWLSSQLRVAVLMDDLGQRDEALEKLKALRAEGIDDDDKLGESYLLEGELQLRRKDRVAALAVYDEGLRALSDDRRLLYARALVAEQLDRIEDAERDLRRIVTLDPEDADALNALGYTLADRTDRHDEALDLIKKALEKKPNEAAIVDSMGWVQFRLGNKDESLKYLRQAYELKPDPEIAAHLGEVLWTTGQRDEARRVWDQGKKLDPKNELLKRTVDRLTR